MARYPSCRDCGAHMQPNHGRWRCPWVTFAEERTAPLTGDLFCGRPLGRATEGLSGHFLTQREPPR